MVAADAQDVAERAEDAAELRVLGEEGCHFGIGEEIAELRPAMGGFLDQAQQPSVMARQRVRLAGPGLAGPGRARPGWAGLAQAGRRGDGVQGVARNALSEAAGDAVQAVPDMDEELARQAGQAQAPVAAPADHLAQALDDEGEAVCRGKRDCLVH